jgi:PPOX class probable F420-dependent enzyme
VWFVWDGATFLIYSTPVAKKLTHIAQHPEVALHFNTNAEGEDIQVILGTASIDPSAAPAHENAAYLTKYESDIGTLGMDAKEYGRRFSVAVRIQPWRLRGLEPIPDL